MNFVKGEFFILNKDVGMHFEDDNAFYKERRRKQEADEFYAYDDSTAIVPAGSICMVINVGISLADAPLYTVRFDEYGVRAYLTDEHMDKLDIEIELAG